MSSAPSPQPGRSDAAVQALVNEFMEEKRREAVASAPATARPEMRQLLVIGLSVLCLAAWFAPYPSFESETETAGQAARAQQLENASARVSLYFVARSVAHFRSTQGRLPRSLAEAGVGRDSTIQYHMVSDSVFALAMPGSRGSLRYDSRQPVKELLKGSEQIIATRGH